MDIKLELVAVPVTDVDRAKAFYEQVGFVADHDFTVSEEIRFVQLTPPGSACSIAIGRGLTGMAPGSLDNLQAVVVDIEAAQADLAGAGIEVERHRRPAVGIVRLLPRPRRQRLGPPADRAPHRRQLSRRLPPLPPCGGVAVAAGRKSGWRPCSFPTVTVRWSRRP